MVLLSCQYGGVARLNLPPSLKSSGAVLRLDLATGTNCSNLKCLASTLQNKGTFVGQKGIGINARTVVFALVIELAGYC